MWSDPPLYNSARREPRKTAPTVQQYQQEYPNWYFSYQFSQEGYSMAKSANYRQMVAKPASTAQYTQYYDQSYSLVDQGGQRFNKSKAAVNNYADETSKFLSQPRRPPMVKMEGSTRQRLARDEVMLVNDFSMQTWDEPHYRRWQGLLDDVPRFTIKEDLLQALHIIIDSFPCLKELKLEEKVVNLVYDYLEPDVPIEDRTLGCQLLLRLSNKCESTRIQKRNIDILCQLLSIVKDSEEHIFIVKTSLRDHLMAFPRTTIGTLFIMNIIQTRKSSGRWKGTCLQFVKERLEALNSDHVEGEVEICKCMVKVWNDLRRCGDFCSEDATFILELVSLLRLDLASLNRRTLKPDSDHEAELAEELLHCLYSLNVFAIDEFARLEKVKEWLSPSEGKSMVVTTLYPGADINMLHEHLRHVHTTLSSQKESTTGNLIGNLLTVPLPDQKNSQEVSPPLFSCLPETSFLPLLKHLCNMASKEDLCAILNEEQLHRIQLNITAAIMSIFPSLAKLKEAEYNHESFQVELAEALVIACTFFMPIQRKKIVKCMQTEAIKDRLHSLYALSQSICSEANAGQTTPVEEKVSAAQTIYRIVTEYLKPAEKRSTPTVSATWLEVKESKEIKEVKAVQEGKEVKEIREIKEVEVVTEVKEETNAKEEKDEEPIALAETKEKENVKRKDQDVEPEEKKKKKRRRASELTDVGIRIINREPIGSISVRGRGSAFAPLTLPLQATSVAPPLSNETPCKSELEPEQYVNVPRGPAAHYNFRTPRTAPISLRGRDKLRY